jgi:hypothetical protein
MIDDCSEPLRAFPSWLLRVECERRGALRMISETHTPRGALTIREIRAHMRRDGCGGWPGRVERPYPMTGLDPKPPFAPDFCTW